MDGTAQFGRVVSKPECGLSINALVDDFLGDANLACIGRLGKPDGREMKLLGGFEGFE